MGQANNRGTKDERVAQTVFSGANNVKASAWRYAQLDNTANGETMTLIAYDNHVKFSIGVLFGLERIIISAGPAGMSPMEAAEPTSGHVIHVEYIDLNCINKSSIERLGDTSPKIDAADVSVRIADDKTITLGFIHPDHPLHNFINIHTTGEEVIIEVLKPKTPEAQQGLLADLTVELKSLSS